MGDERFVVVGGGLAGARAAEVIRDGGHEGTLVLVGNETTTPGDRPPLSKAVLAGTGAPESAHLHPHEWYAERRIDLRLGLAATRLDASAHTLSLADGSELGWDRLLLATGSSVRRLDVPGARLANVLYLRTEADSVALRDRLASGGPVVIVGAGWIGLEVAAAARGHGCEVTVVEPQQAPLEGVLGSRVGQFFAGVHAAHGVAFRFGETVERLVGERAVTGVVTTSGERLRADTVVVGIGITPNTRLAEEAGLEVDDGIVCDRALRTSAPDVFAAGDVASWFNPALGRRIRVDHWSNAQHGGVAAGRSMLGQDVSYDPVPYFFSDQYDLGTEYAGSVPRGATTDVVLRGDPETNAFMAFWLDGDRMLAGLHVNVWDTIDDVTSLIRDHTPVDRDALADPRRPLVSG